MQTGDVAPAFTVPDETGTPVSLTQFKGKDVVLFFYPRANTPGCTLESCAFRDVYAKLKAAGVVVLGASTDTPKAQMKFKQDHGLPFPLLADEHKELVMAYGVWKEKNMYGKTVMGTERTTFLIGPDGRIKKIYPKVKPEGHAEAVLAEIQGSKM